MRRLLTTLTPLERTPFTPENIRKTQRSLTPRSMAKNSPDFESRAGPAGSLTIRSSRGVADTVREHVAVARVKHLDETGFRIGVKTRWLHIFSTAPGTRSSADPADDIVNAVVRPKRASFHSRRSRSASLQAQFHLSSKKTQC